MKKLLISAFAALAAFTVSAAVEDETADFPAFPGAEGFGQYTTGGRGGAVYHVTNLDDSGEGSFRWAVNQSGPRTIVFDVSGTIMLQSELRMRNGNVTIAGQTAPGDGICVANYPFVISAPNVIIRYMRFRLGNEALKTNKNAHEGDGLGGMDSRNIIVDHCSVSWSIDECLSVYGSKNITVQWCYVTHSLVNAGHSKGAHGYGGNWGGSGASYHHNLIAHHGSRTPRLGPRPSTQADERMDFRNNVIYNYGGNGCYGGEGMNVNIVNNYYKPGPTSPSGAKGYRIAGLGIRTVDYCLDKQGICDNYFMKTFTSISTNNVTGGRDRNLGNYVTIKGKRYYINMADNTIQLEYDGTVMPMTIKWNSWGKMLHRWGQLFVEGNVNSKYDELTADNWTKGIFDQIDTGSGNDYTFNDEQKRWMRLSEPIPFLNTTTHTAEVAFDRVVDYAGASLSRDAYDAIIADETRQGTASFGNKGLINSQDDVTYADGTTGWPALESLPAPVDTDGDGMPDEWETANGLDPLNPEDGAQATTSGYTNLENYLNSLVAHITTAQNAGGTSLAGIEEVTVAPAAPADGRIYNMMGIQVYEPLAPGIYIRDGRKFIVR